MEGSRRRGRKRRGYSQRTTAVPHCFDPPQSKIWTFLYNLYNFFIIISLIAVLFLYLEHHCANCNARYDVSNVSGSIREIANNLTQIRNKYYQLELKVSKISQEVPKLEGQIEILESIATNLNNENFRRDTISMPHLEFVSRLTKNMKFNDSSQGH